jgi:hypothetical protein
MKKKFIKRKYSNRILLLTIDVQLIRPLFDDELYHKQAFLVKNPGLDKEKNKNSLIIYSSIKIPSEDKFRNFSESNRSFCERITSNKRRSSLAT